MDNRQINFFFPMSRETDIKIPPNLSDQFSHLNLNFGVSSIWTLPYSNQNSQYFISFVISNIYIWNSARIINSFYVKGMIRNNRAVIVKNNDGSKSSLYYILDDNYLYCIKNILDKESKAIPIINKKKNIEAEYITLSRDNLKAIIITKDNHILFADSEGEISSNSKMPSFKRISFIKDFGDNVYIGGFKNILYYIKCAQKVFDDLRFHDYYSQITDIIEVSNQFIIVGYSYDRRLMLAKTSFDEENNQITPIEVGIDYESIHIFEDNSNDLEPSFCIVSKSEITLFNNKISILGKLPISKTDFLISSFKIDNLNKIFVHFSKSGIQSFIPYDEESIISKENFYKVLFHYIYLFNKTRELTDETPFRNTRFAIMRAFHKPRATKKDIASEFYQKLRLLHDVDDLNEFISKSEREGYEAYKDLWTYDNIFLMHKNLIQMMYYIEEMNDFVPYLNTNAIYIFLLKNCSEDSHLYRYSNFGSLNQLLKTISINSLPILFKSIKESLGETFGFMHGIYKGTERLIKLIDDLEKIEENDSKAKIQLNECKILLTRDPSKINIEDILNDDLDEYEQFAIEYNIIDILYEIINRKLDFKRALNYAQINSINLEELYRKFDSNTEIQQKLAVLNGWERFNEFASYKNGELTQNSQNQEKFSTSAFSLLCKYTEESARKDGDDYEISDIIHDLNKFST